MISFTLLCFNFGRITRVLSFCARTCVTWLWKDLDAKQFTPCQLLGCPWKLWGRFKLAMWKVGGTKIERTQARYFCLPSGHVNSRESDFLGKTLRTRKFSTEFLRTQDSENVVGLGDRASVSKLQWLKVRSKAKNRYRYRKSEQLQKTNTSLCLVRLLWNE